MSEKKATIILNGATREVNQPCSVQDLLVELGWKPTQVVVEHNGSVVRRSEAASVSLREGDQVEIILPVAGG